VAAVVAAAASVLDVSVRRDKGIYRNAILPCALFVAYDVAAALIAYTVFRAGAELLKERPTTAAAVVSGLAGPLLMRTKIPVPFQKNRAEELRLVNAVAMLRRLQLSIGAVIDDRCAAGETAWIVDVVLPVIRALPLEDVEQWVIESIGVRYGGVEGREDRKRFVAEVEAANKDSIDAEERGHLMIQILMDTCGRRQVIALVRRAKRQSRLSTAGAPVIPLDWSAGVPGGRRSAVQKAAVPTYEDRSRCRHFPAGACALLKRPA